MIWAALEAYDQSSVKEPMYLDLATDLGNWFLAITLHSK